VAEAYDIIIRGGRVLDGQGNPWVRADIGIRDGRFATIGRVTGSAKREINAGDRYVTPGWIDMMDQSGWALRRNGLAESKLRQGVTTLIAGEGGAPAPSAKLAAWFDHLAEKGIAPSFATYYGAAQARIEVMGDVDGRPTSEQVASMKAHVAEAMEAGAMGIATALIYPPDSFQTTDDLVALSEVAASYGGIYASHMRDESAALLDGIAESIEIGRRAKIQVEIFHFKAAYAEGWGRLTREAGRLIEQARASGVNIAADMYVYDAGGTGVDITTPNWVWADGRERGLERLKDPAVRARIKAEVAEGSQPGWSNLVHAAGGWDRVVLVNAHSTEFNGFRFKSLAAIGEALGRDPSEVACDIVVAAPDKRPTALYFLMSEPDIEEALRFPWMSIGSDADVSPGPGEIGPLGMPHPRAFGNHPRVIAEYVKARGVLSLEDAVRKMTSWPASRMGLYDRGSLREGLWADVTIFDLERIKDRAAYEDPTAYPEGIDYVLVNGALVIDEACHTGATPGQVLRGPAGLAGLRAG
jgi:N-acyl-D-amino-acid deacylase